MSSQPHRFDPVRKDILISDERQARWKPLEFMSRFNIPAGSRVADLGCGPGFWTLPLAELVGPEGIVWALDVSQEMLDALRSRRPPSQVRLVKNELPTINLDDGAADFALAAFVLHEVTDLQFVARELFRISKRVAIMEWRRDAVSEAGPPRTERLLPDQLNAPLKLAGFTNARETWHNEDNYLIEAEK